MNARHQYDRVRYAKTANLSSMFDELRKEKRKCYQSLRSTLPEVIKEHVKDK